MKLIYLYIIKSDNNFIANQGFNFSNEYDIGVKLEDNIYIVNISMKQLVFKHAYNNLYNISAVVGVNGSGKSTIISSLINLHSSKKGKCFTIFESDGSLYCYSNSKIFENIRYSNIQAEKLVQTENKRSLLITHIQNDLLGQKFMIL